VFVGVPALEAAQTHAENAFFLSRHHLGGQAPTRSLDSLLSAPPFELLRIRYRIKKGRGAIFTPRVFTFSPYSLECVEEKFSEVRRCPCCYVSPRYIRSGGVFNLRLMLVGKRCRK
jgi:hypothetical protein